MARTRPPLVGVYDEPPDARSLVAPERDVRTGRPSTLNRDDKGRQRPTEPRPQPPAAARHWRRWLVGAGVLAGALAVGGFVLVAARDDPDDAAAGAATPAQAAGSTVPTTAGATTTGAAVTTVGGLAPPTVTPATAAATIAGGAGTYLATSTSNGWTWLYTPAPPGFEQPPPYGAETRWPQPGEVDAQPTTVVLVGACDGSGPCALDRAVGNPSASFISLYTFRDTALQPTGDGGYQLTLTDPGGGVDDCTPVLSVYSYRLDLRPTAEGWAGTSSTHMTYSSHVDVVYSDGPSGNHFTVCDGHDFASTFVLQRQV